MRELTKKEERWVEKVKDTLKLGGRSDKTIGNYVCAINRFLKFYDEKEDIKKLKEDDIINYLKKEYLDKDCSGNTYNMNVCAIRYMYSVCFNFELNKRLLPNTKLRKRLPIIMDKSIFLNLLNNESDIKHKCWLLLAFCSGLRVEEVATIRIENIDSKEHSLKVIGKGNKERITILPGVTIKFLRLYCKKYHIIRTNGFLFEGNLNKEHINSKSIINYFTLLKPNYNLPKEVTFHSLRHSFATYFIRAGGDLLVLKSMMGHVSLISTAIYVHLARDFNNLAGIKYA